MVVKVSIVVPAYNAARWISATVQSVLAQTFGGWEMWIVDDGSTDATLDEVRRYLDPRIRVVSQPHSGQEVARQAATKRATGSHVIFLDADDLWLPTALHHLTETARREPNAVIHGDWAYVDANGENPVVNSSYFTQGPGLGTLVLRNPCQQHCVLIPRAFLDDCECLPVDEAFLCDWYRWLKLALSGRSFVHVPQLVALYRLHADGYSKDAARRKRQRLATLDDFWRDPRVPGTLFTLKPASYATAYVDLACDAWREGDFERAWQELQVGRSYDVALLNQVDTFYRLLHAREEKGFSPDAGLTDVQWLWHRWQSDNQPASGVRSALYAALGLACYQRKAWAAARLFLGEALSTASMWERPQRAWLRPYVAAHVPGLLMAKRNLGSRLPLSKAVR